LSFPFWGNRPGHERPWIDWGFAVALAYISVFGAFVYFMVNKYSPDVDGKLDDQDEAKPEQAHSESPSTSSGNSSDNKK